MRFVALQVQFRVQNLRSRCDKIGSSASKILIVCIVSKKQSAEQWGATQRENLFEDRTTDSNMTYPI